MKQALTVEIHEELKAHHLKWTCEKGHTNFIVSISDNCKDTCLKCGKHYEIKTPKL